MDTETRTERRPCEDRSRGWGDASKPANPKDLQQTSRSWERAWADSLAAPRRIQPCPHLDPGLWPPDYESTHLGCVVLCSGGPRTPPHTLPWGLPQDGLGWTLRCEGCSRLTWELEPGQPPHHHSAPGGDLCTLPAGCPPKGRAGFGGFLDPSSPVPSFGEGLPLPGEGLRAKDTLQRFAARKYSSGRGHWEGHGTVHRNGLLTAQAVPGHLLWARPACPYPWELTAQSGRAQGRQLGSQEALVLLSGGRQSREPPWVTRRLETSEGGDRTGLQAKRRGWMAGPRGWT